jgi:hypothetical protein
VKERTELLLYGSEKAGLKVDAKKNSNKSKLLPHHEEVKSRLK